MATFRLWVKGLIVYFLSNKVFNSIFDGILQEDCLDDDGGG